MTALAAEPTAPALAATPAAVPPGYKRTEVGVIPEDWDVRRLRDCLRKTPSYGINAPAAQYDDSLPTYLRITDISEDGHFAPAPRVSVRHAAAISYYLEQGDLVFARTGASVGKSYLYRPKDGPLVFAGFLICVKPNPNVLDPGFLSYFVQSEPYWNWVRTMSARSGQPGINGQEFGTLDLPVPRLGEQRAIAAALSGSDGAIEALDKLIAKKRAVKQAAMQQLLTGRARLPGFSGEWTECRLADLGRFAKGRGIKRDDVTEDGVGCVRYGEIYTRYNNYILEPYSHIPRALAYTALPIKKGDLLFAGSGETAEEIGKCVAYLGEEEAYAGGDVIVLTPSAADAMYLGHFLNQGMVAELRARLGQGDAVVHISTANLGSLALRLPRLQEQQAIGAVLFDMDREIVALERRRDKTQAIKQGMMQALLTGRVRLVQPVAGGAG